jgi:hypothetical protein
MLKLLALLAGIAGVVGFFLPLAQYTDADGKNLRTASAYEIATTDADATGLADFAKGLGASEDQAEKLESAANKSLLAYRGAIVAFYIPAALLALLALVNLLRRRMGRLAGFFTMLFGAANAAVFIYFWIGYERNADPNTALGYGVWLLAGAGLGGLVAGLATMFVPDND